LGLLAGGQWNIVVVLTLELKVESSSHLVQELTPKWHNMTWLQGQKVKGQGLNVT